MRAHASRRALPLLAALFLYSPAAAEDGAKVYLDGMKSAVLVLNDRGGQGSGSVINLKEGYILTNWHVVQGSANLLVVFPMWEQGRLVVEAENYVSKARKIGVPSKVVCSDQKVDLAVVKLNDVSKIPPATVPVRFAADSPFAGHKIYSIGNPGASEALWIYTPGDVRSVYKKSWKAGSKDGKIVSDHEARIIEATSPTNSGDSGGPCFNDKCEMVGVTQGGLRSTVAQGFSYFIDVSEVRGFLKANKVTSSATDVLMQAEEPRKPASKGTDLARIEPKKEGPKVDTAAEELARKQKAAAGMLNLLKPLAKDPSKKAFVVGKLQQLVQTYPGTESAKEAETLLKQLQ